MSRPDHATATAYRWSLALTAPSPLGGTERLTARGTVTPGPGRSLDEVRDSLINRARGRFHLHLNDLADETRRARRGGGLTAHVEYIHLTPTDEDTDR